MYSVGENSLNHMYDLQQIFPVKDVVAQLRIPFLSTGGTSTGEPVCLSVLQKKIEKRFGDYCLHSGTFYDRVVLVSLYEF